MTTATKSKLPSRTEMAAAIGGLERWHHQCHAASIALVKSGIFGDTFIRVARGFTNGVGGQHSWVVVGDDCYDPRAMLIDATLWSYKNIGPTIYLGTRVKHEHTPHGSGSIWLWGRPGNGGQATITLTPKRPLSDGAIDFLRMCGPLDRRGWHDLAHAPVGGWPAGEIYEAMDHTPALRALVPVDRLGMLTTLNPGGLYLADGEKGG